jgi:RinA family phage transcriptional activator
MTFDQVRPIVEARLYAYAALKAEYPDTPISSIYEGLGTIIEGGENTSPQERWAMRHANELRNAMIIEKMLGALPDEERQLIEMRYFEYAQWGYICKRLSVSRPTAYRIRDRALMALACEFDLLAAS